MTRSRPTRRVAGATLVWLLLGCGEAILGIGETDVTHGKPPALAPVVAIGTHARGVVLWGVSGYFVVYLEPDGVTVGAARIRCGPGPGASDWQALEVSAPKYEYRSWNLTGTASLECNHIELELVEVCVNERCDTLRFSGSASEFMHFSERWPSER